MPKLAFAHVDTWVFDLDNTLYPPQMRLFDQIETRMTRYVMQALDVSQAEADSLRRRYWAEYGTTLAGLMRVHDLDPGPYLDWVHEIDFTPLQADDALRAAIAALPGRKIIYTNGTASYAERVCVARGLGNLFDAIYGVEHAGYRPKPEAEAFSRIFARDGCDPRSAAMFEDDPRNLAAPHDMGLRTVLVAPEPIVAAHIDHHTADLGGFLHGLRG